VFTALVNDKNQPLELMAYAIYKADKNEIAESLKAAQKTQPQIEAEIKAFHDLVLNSTSLLQNYHVRARALGQNLIDELKAGVASDARQDFIDRMEQLVKTEKSWFHYVGGFVMDAIKGVLSTLFVIVLFGGVYSLTLSKDDRAALYKATGQSLVDAATGELPVVDNFRNEMAKKKKEQQEKSDSQQHDQPPVARPQN
jgi:hypothetical protein